MLGKLCEISAVGFSLFYDSYTTVYLGKTFTVKDQSYN